MSLDQTTVTKPCMFCKKLINTRIWTVNGWIPNGWVCEPCYHKKLDKAIADKSYYRRGGSQADWDEYYYLTR